MAAHTKFKDVILFKSKGNDNEECNSVDEYELELSKNALNCIFIPTLQFDFINSEILTESLNSVSEFSGLILTSQRSIEALSRCMSHISKEICSEWKSQPCFVVGQKSHEKCKSLLDLDAFGKESGSAKALIPVIIKHMKSTNKPLLFPCGDKKISTIVQELPDHGLEVKEITVYKTSCHECLEKELLALKNTMLIKDALMVFFSPSGLQYVLNILKKHGHSVDELSCVSIGPSTAKAIKDANLKLCCSAEKPNAKSLVSEIKSLLKL